MRELARRDPALPVLGLLAEPEALAERLGSTVHPRRLRYKPGTSLYAAVTVGEDDDWYLLAGYGPRGGGTKIVKDRVVAESRGHCAIVDDALRMVVVPAVADRAFRRRAIDAAGPTTEIISYNPRRRLILRAAGPPPLRPPTEAPTTSDAQRSDALVKVHHDGPRIDDALVDALRTCGVPIPAPLPGGHRHVQRRGWCVGRHPDPASDGEIVAVALDALHRAHPTVTVPRWSLAGHLQKARRALDQVVVFLPGQLPTADAVLAGLRSGAARRALEPEVVLHGDLSADQVLIDRDGAWLIDLDACAYGPRSWDRASWLAAQIACGSEIPLALPGPESDPFVFALALALRSPEPFVRQRSGWVATTRRMLHMAEGALRTPGACNTVG